MSTAPTVATNPQAASAETSAPARMESLEDIFASVGESAATKVVPQPNEKGEFGCPADGAKWMAATYQIQQTPLLGKAPILKDWPNKGSLDFEQIDAWAKEFPGCNFGSIAKAEPGGRFVFEVDSPGVSERAKADGVKFSSQLIITSRPGRGHRWFEHSDESIALGNIAQGEVADFSVRMNNEQCVSPGSVNPVSGKQYRVKEAGTLVPATWAEINWWRSQKTSTSTGKKDIPRNAAGLVPHGAIHGYMLTLAGKLRQNGMNSEEIETVLLRKVHEECQGPIDENKVKAMARSIGHYPEGNPASEIVLLNGAVAGTNPHNEMLQIVADEILEFSDSNPEAEIPPFDSSVMTGVYREWVDLVCQGTTLAPQFSFLIAKTIIGVLMSGRVTFEDLDAEPRIYAALVGETGSGKGAAWDRSLQIINSVTSGLKIVNSIDSGAGLSDYFFEPPVGQPVVCYIDEVTSLGNKAATTRNPAILDAIIELADSTSRSRVLAKRGKNPERVQKTRNDCRLAMVMCGQNRDVFAKALTGRNQLGVYDRLTPEYGVPVEPGKMPPIDKAAAMLLMTKILSLDYQAAMKMSPAADDRLEAFWGSQEKETRVKVRWKRNLQMDSYMTAFGERRHIVEVADVEIAIKNCIRQLAIRKACFGAEMIDRTAYYLDKIKQVTAWMQKKIAEGAEPGQVARSRRDYEKMTNAARDNGEHLFDKAWQIHSRVHLDLIKVRKTNGQQYDKFVPKPDW